MQSVVSSEAITPQRAAEVEHAWDDLEGLLEQVAICASSSYWEPRADRSAMLAELRAVCQATLLELYRLRSILESVDCPTRGPTVA